MTRPEVVFFDLDDTLYDQAAPFAHAVYKVVGAIPQATDAALFEASRRHSADIFAALASGQRPTAPMYVRRMRETLGEFGVEIDTAQALELQRVYSSDSEHAMRLFPGMDACLALCGEQARVGVISNGRVGHQLSKLDELGTWRWIDPDLVFVSEGLGLAKPNPAIFLKACEGAQTSCEKSLFIGDAWAIDVVGATRAAMPVVWFNHRRRQRPADPAPGWEVTTTDALHELLEQLLG